MRKILGLTILAAAVFAAVGVGTGSAAGGCTAAALSETFDHSAISSGSPFGSGTVTVSGVTSTSSTSATVTLDDGAGDTLVLDLSGTTTGSTHLVFASSGGTIDGAASTGACAGATGSVTAGVLKGENGNTTWESTTDIAGGAVAIASGSGGSGASAPPPPPNSAFLCYSAFQSNPGAWTMSTAGQLLGQGYWSPYAVPGNVAGGTNIGGYHLTCNLASDQSATDATVGGAGETYGGSDKGAVPDAPGFYPVAGS